MLKTLDIGLMRGSGGSVKLNLMLSPIALLLWRSLACAMCHLLILRPDLSVMVGPTKVLLVAIFFDFV